MEEGACELFELMGELEGKQETFLENLEISNRLDVEALIEARHNTPRALEILRDPETSISTKKALCVGASEGGHIKLMITVRENITNNQAKKPGTDRFISGEKHKVNDLMYSGVKGTPSNDLFDHFCAQIQYFMQKLEEYNSKQRSLEENPPEKGFIFSSLETHMKEFRNQLLEIQVNMITKLILGNHVKFALKTFPPKNPDLYKTYVRLATIDGNINLLLYLLEDNKYTKWEMIGKKEVADMVVKEPMLYQKVLDYLLRDSRCLPLILERAAYYKNLELFEKIYSSQIENIVRDTDLDEAFITLMNKNSYEGVLKLTTDLEAEDRLLRILLVRLKDASIETSLIKEYRDRIFNLLKNRLEAPTVGENLIGGLYLSKSSKER